MATTIWRKGKLSALEADGLGLLTDEADQRVYNFDVRLLSEAQLLQDGDEVVFHLNALGHVDLVETRASLLALAKGLSGAID